jgi:hypothetical protein
MSVLIPPSSDSAPLMPSLSNMGSAAKGSRQASSERLQDAAALAEAA